MIVSSLFWVQFSLEFPGKYCGLSSLGSSREISENWNRPLHFENPSIRRHDIFKSWVLAIVRTIQHTIGFYHHIFCIALSLSLFISRKNTIRKNENKHGRSWLFLFAYFHAVGYSSRPFILIRPIFTNVLLWATCLARVRTVYKYNTTSMK